MPWEKFPERNRKDRKPKHCFEATMQKKTSKKIETLLRNQKGEPCLKGIQVTSLRAGFNNIFFPYIQREGINS